MPVNDNVKISVMPLTSIRKAEILDKSEIQNPQKLIDVINVLTKHCEHVDSFADFAEDIAQQDREPFFLAIRDHTRGFDYQKASGNENRITSVPPVSVFISPVSAIQNNFVYCIDVSESSDANLRRTTARVEQRRVSSQGGCFGKPGFQSGFQMQISNPDQKLSHDFDKLLDILLVLFELDCDEPKSDFGF